MLINDPDRRLRYGNAGRELSKKRFSIESVVDATMQIYERLFEKTQTKTPTTEQQLAS